MEKRDGALATPPAQRLFKYRGNAGERCGRVRDGVDEILEYQGDYRKHVADEADSVFRAVSDVVFGTQVHRNELKRSYELFGSEVRSRGEDHPIPRVLAGVLGTKFEIVQFDCDRLTRSVITPERGAKGPRTVCLCFTPPRQYDPVYKKADISNSGFTQSIIYRLLYEDIFGVTDASEAADLMLNAPCVPGVEKPVQVARGFRGKAVDALAEHLIPFPYKVAKALDPCSYRNIEYDVWLKGMKAKGALGSKCAQRIRRKIDGCSWKPVEIGARVIVRLGDHHEAVGYVVGMSGDRKVVQAYLPDVGVYVSVAKDAVRPAEAADIAGSIESREASECHQEDRSVDFPNDDQPMPEESGQESRSSPGSELSDSGMYAAQTQNMLTLASGDPEWHTKFNFCVPPPPPSTGLCGEYQQLHGQCPIALVPVQLSLFGPLLTPDFVMPISVPTTPLSPGLFFQFPSPAGTPVLTPAMTPDGKIQQIFQFSDDILLNSGAPGSL